MKERIPPLRPADVFPVDTETGRVVCLRDQFGLIPEPVAISPEAYMVAVHFNGQLDAAGVARAAAESFSMKVEPADVELLAGKLDELFFLDNDRFRARMRDEVDRFESAPFRPAHLAGRSYPADPAELKTLLDGYYKRAGRPAQAGLRRKPADSVNIAGIVVPHIDLNAGGETIAAGYARLREIPQEKLPARVIVLGVGHFLEGDFFSCLPKDFETPLGPVPADKEFIARLESNFGEPVALNSYYHKMEHSVEFQAVFLRHLYSERLDLKIVPLIFSYPEQVRNQSAEIAGAGTVESLLGPKYSFGRIEKFISALDATLADSAGPTLLVSSVDFSHVGMRFGDQAPIDEAGLAEIERVDRGLIELIERCDAEGFFRGIEQCNSSSKICGFPSLYPFLKLLEGKAVGELVRYGYNVEGENDSVVSFASIAMYRR